MKTANELFKELGYDFSGDVPAGARYDSNERKTIIVGKQGVSKGVFPGGFNRWDFSHDEIRAVAKLLDEMGV